MHVPLKCDTPDQRQISVAAFIQNCLLVRLNPELVDRVLAGADSRSDCFC
jgi:hypothetical protein